MNATAAPIETPIAFGYGHFGVGSQGGQYQDRYFAGNILTKNGLEMTLAIVSDGQGDQGRGARAAQMALETIVGYCSNASPGDITQMLGEAIRAANLAIYEERVKHPGVRDMIATLAVATIFQQRLYIANVGHSRIYRIRGKTITQLTLDHTWAADRIRSGTMRAEDARRDPKAQNLMRALGRQPDVAVDLGLYLRGGEEDPSQAIRQQGLALESNDLILVCSDGLVKADVHGSSIYLSQREIIEVVERSTAEQAAKTLVDLAVGRNVDDNVSAVVVEMPGRVRQRFAPRSVQVGIAAAVTISALICIVFGVFLFAAPKLAPATATVTAQPRFAYLVKGNVVYQPAEGEARQIAAGDFVPFEGGSQVHVENGVAVFEIPGNYQVKISAKEGPSQVEFSQAPQYGVPGGVTFELVDGSLLIQAAGGADTSLPVVVRTGSGTASSFGATMGAIFDPGKLLLEVDCFSPVCELTPGNGNALTLQAGQRRTLDASGVPSALGEANRALYPE